MARWGYGIRAKATAALVAACLLALVPAALIGWQTVETIRAHFGEAYARNFTQLHARNITAPVARDLALSQRLADSVLARQWLQDEDSADHRALFFREAEGYRDDFRDGNYFLISADSRHYYLNDHEKAYSEEPRYVLNPDNPDDAWFFRTMDETEAFNINVNHDVALGVTRVWLNVVVYGEDGRKLGLAGTGLALQDFIDDFFISGEPGVTPILLDGRGAIQAHPDAELITYDSVGGSDTTTLQELLPDGGPELETAMERAVIAPEEVETLWVELDGQQQLLALTHIPELDWHVVSAIDLQDAQLWTGPWFGVTVGFVFMVAGSLLLIFGYAVDRLVLRPIRSLHGTAKALAHGDFAVSLPEAGRDELGDLTRAFGAMASQIKAHTEELEERVRVRTGELEQANREMAATQRKVSDSIEYAGLIQRALLPDHALERWFGDDHFIFWRPRDGVGGDFYLFRADGGRYLVGVVDCAGHGVPGALMTMLAHAAFDDAMDRIGIASPAALLERVDAAVRQMVKRSTLPRTIATNMDAGLVCVDPEAGSVRYAGARVPLYWSDGDTIEEIPAGRRALCDRRLGRYEDREWAYGPGGVCYLATDGYLDQAGGEMGYGFGDTRFTALLREYRNLPLVQQAEALAGALDAYQGEYPQRDDITVLSFRVR